MSNIIQRGAVVAGVATTSLAGLAGVAGAATVTGTVIHHNVRAHSFVVADRTGHLYAIHAARAPRIGAAVVVVAKRLHDGTYRLERQRALRAAAHQRVHVRGVVSWSDRATGSFVVSAAGVSLLVTHHGGLRAHAAGSGTSGTTPTVGEEVLATGTVDGQGDGELSDQSVQTTGQVTGGIALEGTVLSVDPVNQTITVSADDDSQSGASITVSVPSTFSLTQFTSGEEVELMVQPTGTGTATLLGSADDGNAQLANNQSDSQGQNPDSAAGAESGGDQSGGDKSGGDDGGQFSASTTGGSSQGVTLTPPSTTSSGSTDN